MEQKTTSFMIFTLFGFLSFLPASAQTSNEPDNPAPTEEIGVEHGKINTADASPVDPGHFEIEPSFSYTRAKHYWDNGGHSQVRGLMHEGLDYAYKSDCGKRIIALQRMQEKELYPTKKIAE